MVKKDSRNAKEISFLVVGRAVGRRELVINNYQMNECERKEGGMMKKEEREIAEEWGIANGGRL